MNNRREQQCAPALFNDLYWNADFYGSLDHVGRAVAAGKGNDKVGSSVEHFLIAERTGGASVLLPITFTSDSYFDFRLTRGLRTQR